MAIVDSFIRQLSRQKQIENLRTGGAYGRALSRTKEREGILRSQFGKGIQELTEAAGYYKPGGEFTKAQYGEIEQATRQGLAKSRIGAVASGMASSTNLGGMLTSALQRQGLAKANVQAQRVSNLAGMKSALAQFRGGYGQAAVSVREPTMSSFYDPGAVSARQQRSSMNIANLRAATARAQMQTQRSIARQQIASREKIAESRNRTSLLSAFA